MSLLSYSLSIFFIYFFFLGISFFFFMASWSQSMQGMFCITLCGGNWIIHDFRAILEFIPYEKLKCMIFISI